MSSCFTKPEEPIAIGVLLTLPNDVYADAVQLNRAILKDHPDNFKLDKDRVPHITLAQCYISKDNLRRVEKALEDFYNTIASDTLRATELQYNTKIPKSFASIAIKRSKSLLKLHRETIALLKPFIISEGSSNSYIQNSDGTPIDQFTMDYVPQFVSDHSFENYNPHISLGVAKTSLLDSLAGNFRPMAFVPTSISIYQLGAFGTARKLVWKSKD